MKRKSMLHELFGVTPIIPLGYPWLSPTSGARLSESVIEAMCEAAKDKVDLRSLLLSAGAVIANLIGVEAAYITSGGSAALTLAAAAVMTGKDLAKMRQLPNTDYPTKLPNEFIVQIGSFGAYTTSFRMAGGKIVWVGGKSSQACEVFDSNKIRKVRVGLKISPQEIEDAITERTAAILVAVHCSRSLAPPLTVSPEDMIKIAKKYNLPAIVDASHLPTAGGKTGLSFMRKYLDMGADLVCISAGKAIEAPNSTGIIYGRKDLVEAAGPQGTSAFPMDSKATAYPEYPRTRSELIGRGFKVSKEQIAGLVVALKNYVERDDQAVIARDTKMCNWMADQFRDFPFVEVIGVIPESDWPNDNMHEGGPSCVLRIDEQALGIKITDLQGLMLQGKPPSTEMAGCDSLAVWKHLQLFSHGLKDGEEEAVIYKLKEILTSKLKTK